MNLASTLGLVLTLIASPITRADIAPTCRLAYRLKIKESKRIGKALAAAGATVSVVSGAALAYPPLRSKFLGVSGAIGLGGLLFGTVEMATGQFERRLLDAINEANHAGPGPASHTLAAEATQLLNDPMIGWYGDQPVFGNQYPLSHVQQNAIVKNLNGNQVTPEHIVEVMRWLIQKDALCTEDLKPLTHLEWLKRLFSALQEPIDQAGPGVL